MLMLREDEFIEKHLIELYENLLQDQDFMFIQKYNDILDEVDGDFGKIDFQRAILKQILNCLDFLEIYLIRCSLFRAL